MGVSVLGREPGRLTTALVSEPPPLCGLGCSPSSEPLAPALSFCVSVLSLLPLVRILPLATEQMGAGITGALGPSSQDPSFCTGLGWLVGGRESSHQVLIHPERQSTTFFGTRSLRLSKLRTSG